MTVSNHGLRYQNADESRNTVAKRVSRQEPGFFIVFKRQYVHFNVLNDATSEATSHHQGESTSVSECKNALFSREGFKFHR